MYCLVPARMLSNKHTCPTTFRPVGFQLVAALITVLRKPEGKCKRLIEIWNKCKSGPNENKITFMKQVSTVLARPAIQALSIFTAIRIFTRVTPSFLSNSFDA